MGSLNIGARRWIENCILSVAVAPWIVEWKIASESCVRKSSLSPTLKELANSASNSARNFMTSLQDFVPESVPIRWLRNGVRGAVFRPKQCPKAPQIQTLQAL
jgi:hypothetical protein